jgi:membrane protein DedA with SNARE-associated domain
MDYLLSIVYQHLDYAPWIIFSALMLAGLNVPISEDLMLITTGLLASAVIPEKAWQLCLAAFLGCYLSDWMVYFFGRYFGRRMTTMRWFRRSIKLERLRKVRRFYLKYGVLTLLVGRFIPFGVRNMLFFTAGTIRMKFLKFITADGIACLISNTTLISVAYFFGKNYDALCRNVRIVNIVIFGVAFVAISSFIIYRKMRKKSTTSTTLAKSEESLIN